MIHPARQREKAFKPAGDIRLDLFRRHAVEEGGHHHHRYFDGRK